MTYIPCEMLRRHLSSNQFVYLNIVILINYYKFYYTLYPKINYLKIGSIYFIVLKGTKMFNY